MDLNNEKGKGLVGQDKNEFESSEKKKDFLSDEKEQEFERECSDSSSIGCCDEKLTNSTIGDINHRMGESVESNLSDFSQFKDSWNCSPFLVVVATILILMFLSSAANLSSLQDCDAVISQVKLISEELKAENEVFKSQLVAEVHEKMYSDLLNKINALKDESEKLNGILQRIANRGFMSFMSNEDIYFGNNTADSVDKIRTLFMKDSAILTLKICTAFLILLGLIKLAWNYPHNYRIEMQRLKKMLSNLKDSVKSNSRQNQN